jgi:hypothetical protein
MLSKTLNSRHKSVGVDLHGAMPLTSSLSWVLGRSQRFHPGRVEAEALTDADRDCNFNALARLDYFA